MDIDKSALVLVDLQYDFMPGGALAVPDGDVIVPLAASIEGWFNLVVATQDWHPADHGSFAANHSGRQPGEVIELDGLQQILWPAHCVQQTDGAALHADLDHQRIAKVFRKGTDVSVDSYSGFFDNGQRKATGLGEYLGQRGIKELVIVGLAADYCVKFTALDARALGFETTLLEDVTRGVELQQGDVDRAFDELREAGVRLIPSAQLQQEIDR